MAFALFAEAARSGFDVAEFSLGLCYDNGEGTVQNFTEALHWYRKASNHGDPAATTNLGQLYLEGRGVKADPHEALSLFNLAAEKGNSKAFMNLANVYYLGRGIEPDPITAFMWLEIAGAMGESVSAARKEVAAKLTPSEIDEAIRRAQLWQANHPNSEAIQRYLPFVPAGNHR